ncbi:MAG TPA: DNA-3-methyladenine glycosylase I [Gammaproteobacteria bacterium]|nr:DNA-3-methyladenine glycosylase I [Gammaproteobacteria bacterium]
MAKQHAIAQHKFYFRGLIKRLKKHGFKFLGNKIYYAFMQAVGIVNDHTVDFFLYKKVSRFSK